MICLHPIHPASYKPSVRRAEDRVWVKTNCNVDLWIELPHKLGTGCAHAPSFPSSGNTERDQWRLFNLTFDEKPAKIDVRLRGLASLSKTAQFQSARMVSSRRTLGVGSVLDASEHESATATKTLAERHG